MGKKLIDTIFPKTARTQTAKILITPKTSVFLLSGMRISAGCMLLKKEKKQP